MNARRRAEEEGTQRRGDAEAQRALVVRQPWRSTGRRLLAHYERRGAPLVCVLLLWGVAAPAADWAVGDADARVHMAVEGDLYARENADCGTIIDFNRLLGMRRVLAADSLSLRDGATGDVVGLEVEQDAEIRYASGNPILRLRWAAGPLGPFERRAWHLYFRTVGRAHEAVWQPLDATFVPRPADVLLDSSFEFAAARPDWPALMNPGGRDVKGETTERVWTDEDAHSGKRSLKIARTFEDEPQRNSNRPFWWTWPPPMPVRPGQGVRLSAWLKALRLDTRGMPSVALEFRDATRKRIGEGRLWLRGGRIPHDWKEVTSSTIAPPGSASAVFWFTLHGGGEAYCDDVKVTTVPGGAMPRLDVAVGPLEGRAAFAVVRDERPEGKMLSCGIVQAAPLVDGALDDACWKAAGRVRDFEVHTQVRGSSVETTVLACADSEALYFGFRCTEPNTTDLKANATKRDGRLWEDDSVELFLDTNGDLHTYYQIIVNSRGAFFDQDKGAPGLAGAKWDGPVTAAACVLPDRWTAEVKLEFTGLRLAEAEGRVWGANFARSSFRGGRSLYVWSPVKKNFGEPQHFGRIVLPFDPTANVVTGRPLADSRVFWGDGTLGFEVTNRRDRPAAVRVTATEEAADHGRKLGTTGATVGARSAVELRIPASFPQPGEARVCYELVEAKTNKRLYRTSVMHHVPEPLLLEPATLVSYLGEKHLPGVWTLGLDGTTVADARLELAVLAADGEITLATSEIAPSATAGTYALDVTGVPAGRYRLRARLLQGGRSLGAAGHRFERIAGPFSPTP